MLSAAAPGRRIVWGRPMDRVLQVLLRSFIRRGTLRVTTARGTTLEFGDGTGTPVAVRFTTLAAEWAILLDPELAVGETYMNGTLVIEQGSIADFLALAMSQQEHSRQAAAVDAGAMAAALSLAAPRAIQPADARAPQRRAPLRPRQASLRAVPRCRPAIQLRLFRASRAVARRRAARARSATSRRSCWSSRPARVLDIGCGLGRPCALSRRDVRRAGRPASRSREEQLALARNRADEKGSPARSSSGCRTIATSREHVRPHRVGRHVRACRRQPLRHLLRQVRRAALRRRRDAAALDRPLGGSGRHQSVDREVHLPGRLHSGPVGGAPGGRARRACWSPTSRFSG